MTGPPLDEAQRVLDAPKRAYRYKVTETGGDGTKAVGDSPHLLDWKYLGKTYTWNIFGGPKFEPLGFITGRYVDKGHIIDGQYKTDAEQDAALARAGEAHEETDGQ